MSLCTASDRIPGMAGDDRPGQTRTNLLLPRMGTAIPIQKVSQATTYPLESDLLNTLMILHRTWMLSACFSLQAMAEANSRRHPGLPLDFVDRFPDAEVLNINPEDRAKFLLRPEHRVRVQALDPNSGGPVSSHPGFCRGKNGPCHPVNGRARRPSPRSRRVRSILNGTDLQAADNEVGQDRTRRCHREVKVEAFGQAYTLCLFLRPVREDPIVVDTWARLNVSVYGSGNASRDWAINDLLQDSLSFAVGYILEEPASSFASASGYLMDGQFRGTVYMKDSVHYLEPNNRKIRDLRIFGDGLNTLLHRKMAKGGAAPASGSNKGPTGSTRKLCDLTVVADHLFFHDVGEGSVEKTVLQMLWHIKEANSLLQTYDFDSDGRSECLGVTVSEITIFKDPDNPSNLLAGSFSVPEDFLKRFSRYNFDGFCLGVLFTNRVVGDLVLGLSWRGNPEPDGVGGSCQGRVRIKLDRNAYSFNALFVSLKSSQEERIPLRMGVLNLVHELMHSFGAKHDPDQSEDPSCTPKDKLINGRFLMSRFSNDGHKLNHMILSPCTKATVAENLASANRVGCLTNGDHRSFCGDGIVQPGEECDCGTIFHCMAARSCCVPPEGSGLWVPCTLNKASRPSCVMR